jgi:hypothetical protein
VKYSGGQAFADELGDGGGDENHEGAVLVRIQKRAEECLAREFGESVFIPLPIIPLPFPVSERTLAPFTPFSLRGNTPFCAVPYAGLDRRKAA